MQDQVGRIDLCMERDVVTRILMAGKFHHSFDECFQVKQWRFRSRYPCEFAVGFYESKQPFSRGTDGLQSVADLFVFVLHHREKRIAERSDGSHGVHDLMSQYSGQANPWVYLLFVQLNINIIQCKDAQMFFVYIDFWHANRQIDCSPFIVKHHLQLISGTTIFYLLHQCSIYFTQLADMGKYIQSQKPECFFVFLIDRSVIIEHQQSRADKVKNQFVVLFLLGSLCFYII